MSREEPVTKVWLVQRHEGSLACLAVQVPKGLTAGRYPTCVRYLVGDEGGREATITSRRPGGFIHGLSLFLAVISQRKHATCLQLSSVVNAGCGEPSSEVLHSNYCSPYRIFCSCSGKRGVLRIYVLLSATHFLYLVKDFPRRPRARSS